MRLIRYKKFTWLITIIAICLNIFGWAIRPYIEINSNTIEQLLVIATMFATVSSIYRWARILSGDIN